MIRMMRIGYCLGIRSDRLLCEEVKLNLAYRWFCKLKISDPVPDHSTFFMAKIPTRMTRHIFVTIEIEIDSLWRS
jgi:IS5 family transposase